MRVSRPRRPRPTGRRITVQPDDLPFDVWCAKQTRRIALLATTTAKRIRARQLDEDRLLRRDLPKLEFEHRGQG